MNTIHGFRVALIGAVLIAPAIGAQSRETETETETETESENWTLKPYTANRDQFTLDIPDAWFVVDQAPYSATGVVAFYSQPLVMKLDADPAIRAQEEKKMMALADDLMSGAAPAFFMDRNKAGKGMSCAGFDEPAKKKKLKVLLKARALGKGAKPTGQPEVSNTEFAGCQGLRFLIRAGVANGDDQRMLVYTAAVGDLTYDFVLLTDAKYFAQNLPWFERIIATVRLTGAH